MSRRKPDMTPVSDQQKLLQLEQLHAWRIKLTPSQWAELQKLRRMAANGELNETP